ncbi:MAG: serine/threonine protein kinase [Okeania sp. SIO2H7]|nr:serine/threonine protein kinase [Okeania sp. SIO2H7]
MSDRFLVTNKIIRKMIGRILNGTYKIISELGQGGFGTTYLAIDRDKPNHRVVKQLTINDPQVFTIAKRLFDQEVETLKRLGKHNQIPKLFDNFEEGGQFYLVQEFIEGHDLTEEIYSGSFNEARTIQLLIEILEVLEYVHEQGVIHRDLKPQNIMRRTSDGKIVLIDFGAVKHKITGLTVTNKTIAVGTPEYMPMEQMKGEPRFCSDIYAVGVMGIEALTRTHASQFVKDSSGEIIWKDKANVSSKFAGILDKMIKDYWQHRYQTVAQVITELRGIGSYAGNNRYSPSNNYSPQIDRTFPLPSGKLAKTEIQKIEDSPSFLEKSKVILYAVVLFATCFLAPTAYSKVFNSSDYWDSLINKIWQGHNNQLKKDWEDIWNDPFSL